MMEEGMVQLDEWLKDEDNEFGGNGLNRDELETLGEELKALGAQELLVKVSHYGTDELYIKTIQTEAVVGGVQYWMIPIGLAVAIAAARPDECGLENDMIRLWWD